VGLEITELDKHTTMHSLRQINNPIIILRKMKE